jgi:dTDP-glucose 4,6-dehydratase
MRVLVTGAGGFIGSHLAERLVEEGANVKAFVHYNALDSRGWLDKSQFLSEMEIHAGDIQDRDSVNRAVEGVEIIYHLAALIAIPYSYHAPQSYVNTNVTGTLNILSAARDIGGIKVIHTSTSEVYGSAQYVPIDENHPLQGQSPYSASKIGADKMAEAFHLSFDLPVVTLRPFNTFGPRQSARAVIPTIIAQCLSDNVIHLGNIHPTRDLNYVSNTVEGFILASTKKNAIGHTINLGSGREISIGNLVYLIGKFLKKEIQIHIKEERIRPQRSEVDRLLASNKLAKELLDWVPEVDLEDGLVKTIDWIKKNENRYQVGKYVI